MFPYMQVGQFANCLVEAKNELQHKYAVKSFPFYYFFEL